jgi:hypothetical protein
MQGKRQGSHTNAHRLDVILQQNFSWMNGTHAIFEHDAPLNFEINRQLVVFRVSEEIGISVA